MWLGHMSRLSVRPLNAKATPANAAAKLLSAQRRARKNIPTPANHRCSRQKKLNDHGQRQQEINQRQRVERHGVPLREKRHTAIVAGIPERQFPVPETFLLKMGEGIGEKSIVADDEGFQSEEDLRKRGENQQRQQQRKPPGRKPWVNRVSGFTCGWLHPGTIKTSDGAKCNAAEE